MQARAASVAELAKRAAATHAATIYTPTGGARVLPETLENVRKAIVDVAATFGYPAPPNGDQAAGFDAAASVALFKLVDVTPAEASKSGVWDFLSCVLLPDLVRWRFYQADGASSLERFLAGRRNSFQRLWWRAYHLTHGHTLSDTELGKLLVDMGEDELVQLMERPALAGIFRLSATVATGLLAAAKRAPSVSRRLLMREGQKRLLRVSSFVALDAVSQEEAAAIIEKIFGDVAAAALQ
ncbi:MAG TPA: DUF6339 family protein [Albitalea sp.]